MIKGTCLTNLDNGKNEKWPTTFVAIPQIGDSVESESGMKLRVCQITHKQTKGGYNISDRWVDGEPCIEVELSK